MTQNKYFSPGRFARLLRNDLMINQKTYLFAIAGLFIAMYAIAYFLMRKNGFYFTRNSDFSPMFLYYLMGMGIIIGTAFQSLANEIKTSNYLLMPGSTFEKFMVQFLIRMVIFIPLALAIFWMAVHLAKASLVPIPKEGFHPFYVADFQFKDLFPHITGKDIVLFILTTISIYSLLFAGSVYFNRYALVKTLIFSGLIFLAWASSFVLFSYIFYPTKTHGFEIELKVYRVTKDLNNTAFFAFLFGKFSWLFFLPLAYFKLKEKEV